MCSMNQTKRLTSSNHSDKCEDSKRLKLDDNRTLFEDLSNEIIYDIYEYLASHHVYESFYNLNQRFQNLFIHSDLPILINISSISKQIFHNYMKDIIMPNEQRIQSIQFANSLTVGMSKYLFSMMKNFTKLKALIIHDIQSEHIDELIDSLSCLPCLTTLNIACADKTTQTNRFYQKIFRLPALRYFQMKIDAELYHEILPLATNEFSSIEHLVINNEIKLAEIDSLLSYVPKLRHLSLNNLSGLCRNRKQRTSNTLIYLNSASLRINLIEFNDFELLITDFFSQISRLSISCKCSSFEVPQYLHANRWERLISTHMPNLCIFDFQHEMLSTSTSSYQQTFENQIIKFDSIFWTTHQWFFEYCYYRARWLEHALFFSTNPYRKSKYILGKGLSDRIHSNVCSVKQLCIHDANAMKTFPRYFPNVTELSLSNEFNTRRKSLASDLNRILSLRYVTDLILNCQRFHFEQIIELLYFTPNVHTLKLDAVLLFRTRSNSIQQTDLFRLVSSTNTVSHLTINQRMTLEKIKLITALFPPLECLTINLANYDLKPIVRFLLSNSNYTKNRLSLLCFTKRSSTFYQDLDRFISQEKLLNDYTLKFNNEKMCLWW